MEYDGSRYRGWQVQDNARSVMGELRKAAAEVFQGPVDIQGAGRTDAGVHALEQVAHLRISSHVKHPVHVLRDRLNHLLPADIVVLEIARTSNTFHARRDACARIYVYRISTRKQAFRKKYVWWVKEALDIAAMRRAAAFLSGSHTFICFRAEDHSRKDESTTVVVENAQIEVEGDIIHFRIEASHFLWRMVRRIVGALVKVGLGELDIADFRKLLDGHCDPKLDVPAWTAPAAGLFLEKVKYRDK